jgi:hypothetical protein
VRARCADGSTLALLAERTSAHGVWVDAYVLSVRVSPDGTMIVSGAGCGSIRLWSGCCHTLAWTNAPCRYIVAWQRLRRGYMCVLRADASTLALLAEQTSAHTGDVQSVSFSPDGAMVVSGSRDFSIKLWGERCCLSCGEMTRACPRGWRWAAAEARTCVWLRHRCVCSCVSGAQTRRRWRWWAS